MNKRPLLNNGSLNRFRGKKQRDKARCYGSRFLINWDTQLVAGWCKNISAETVNIREWLEFSAWSVSRRYLEDNWHYISVTRHAVPFTRSYFLVLGVSSWRVLSLDYDCETQQEGTRNTIIHTTASIGLHTECQKHKMETHQFPPTNFKHLMMKNVCRNI